MAHKVLEVIGDTTAPEGCEAGQVRIVDAPREPIEVVFGCMDICLSVDEAMELAALLTKAAGRGQRHQLGVGA